MVRQLVDQLRTHLVNGVYKPGQPLPAVRTLAAELHVHFNTVAEAYRQLAEEGWLEVRHGRAAIVCAREEERMITENDWRNFRIRMRALVAEMRSRGLEAPKLAEDLRALADEVSR